MSSSLLIKVVSEAEAEQCDLVVCIRKIDLDPTLFPDNHEATCHDCGEVISFRPSAPKTPIKVCLQCATARATGGHA